MSTTLSTPTQSSTPRVRPVRTFWECRDRQFLASLLRAARADIHRSAGWPPALWLAGQSYGLAVATARMRADPYDDWRQPRDNTLAQVLRIGDQLRRRISTVGL